MRSHLNPMVVDLFCGCGGFGLAAHLAGFSTAWAADIDPVLASSYPLNFAGIIPKQWDLSIVPDAVLTAECGRSVAPRHRAPGQYTGSRWRYFSPWNLIREIPFLKNSLPTVDTRTCFQAGAKENLA